MKRINYKFLLTEGIPELTTIGLIPFIILAFCSGWIHGTINTIFSIIVLVLCTSSAIYREHMTAKDKVSKTLFGIFCLSFTIMIVSMSLLYSTGNRSIETLLWFVVALYQAVAVGYVYCIAWNEADKAKQKQKVKAACRNILKQLAAAFVAAAALLLCTYMWGSEMADIFGMSRLESWQIALHRLF